MKSWSLAEIFLCFISSSLCWALPPNCTFQSCPVCLSNKEQKAFVTKGPDGKAYTSAFRIGRNERYWDSQSLVSTVLGILTAEKLGIATEYVPAVDVTTAILSMSNCENWMSGECRRTFMDSTSPESAANAFATGFKLFKDPLPDIMFHAEVLGWKDRYQLYPMVDWAKTHLTTFGSIGFHSTDHLYVFRELAEEAFNSSGFVLDYWRSYTTSSVLPYFETPRQLMAAGVTPEMRGCSSSDELVQAGMDVHTELGYTCTQDSWWLTPSCAAMGDNWKDACVPVLDDHWGFVKRRLYEKMAVSGMRLAKVTVGYDMQYELIMSSKHKALFHWWDTDTMFLGRQPMIVNMQPSLIGDAPLNKVVHKPSLAGNERLNSLLRSLTITNDKLNDMLYPAAMARHAELFDNDSQMFQKVACDWLRANPELVASWLLDSRVCLPGHAFDDSTSRCEACPPGTYSAQSETSLVLECVPCPRGSYANASGHSECRHCLSGRYADSAGDHSAYPGGATHCKSCHVIVAGSSTLFPAAASKDDCTCPEKTYHRKDSGCTHCDQGLHCPGGLSAPLQAEGYYGMILPEYGMDRQEWFFLFRCHADARRCPRARLGLCARGREGLACAKCQVGLTPRDDGTCGECKAGSREYFILAFVGVASAILVLYFLLDNDIVAKQSHTKLLVGVIGSVCLGLLQQLGTIGTIQVEWRDPVSSMLDFMQVFSFDIEVISADCMISLTPMWMYACKICVALAVVGLALPVHVAVVLLRHQGSFSDRLPTLINSVGTLLFVFQVAIVNVSIPPFHCQNHPSRFSTVVQYPTIMCGWEDGGQQWQTMAIIGICSTSFVCAWISGCLFAVYRLPKQTKKNNVIYTRSFTFLFARFKPDDYWFSAVLICRNLLVSLTPLLPDSTSQLTCLQCLQVLYLLVAVHFFPWRIRLANYLDCLATVVLIVFLSCAASFVNTPNTEAMAWICWVLVISVFVFNAIILCIESFPTLFRRFRKPFSFFICHDKAGTGAFARLLELHLTQLSSISLRYQRQKVFIDSDGTLNLELILDYITNQSEHIVVLMSKEFLIRPWCTGKLVAAHLRQPGLKMVPVFWPDFSQPDDDFISKCASRVDCKCLLSHGITITMIQSMLEWLRDLPGLSLPALVTRDIVTGIAARIVKGSSCQDVDGWDDSLHPNQSQISSRVIAIADNSNIESVATALLLCNMIAPLTAQDPSCAPRLLAENEDFPESAGTCMLILSGGAFLELSFARRIVQAAGLGTMVLPIIAQHGFRFPGQSFLAQYLQMGSALLQPHETLEDPKILAQLLESLCEEVAIVFAPESSLSTEELLRMKARAVCDRLVTRQMPRLAFDKALPQACFDDSAMDEDTVPSEIPPGASKDRHRVADRLLKSHPSQREGRVKNLVGLMMEDSFEDAYASAWTPGEVLQPEGTYSHVCRADELLEPVIEVQVEGTDALAGGGEQIIVDHVFCESRELSCDSPMICEGMKL